MVLTFYIAQFNLEAHMIYVIHRFLFTEHTFCHHFIKTLAWIFPQNCKFYMDHLRSSHFNWNCDIHYKNVPHWEHGRWQHKPFSKRCLCFQHGLLELFLFPSPTHHKACCFFLLLEQRNILNDNKVKKMKCYLIMNITRFKSLLGQIYLFLDITKRITGGTNYIWAVLK